MSLRTGSEVVIVGAGSYLFTLRGKKGIVLSLRGAFVRVYVSGEGWMETLLRDEVQPV